MRPSLKRLALFIIPLALSTASAQVFSLDKVDRFQFEGGGLPFIVGESLLLMDAAWKTVSAPTSAKITASTSPTGVALAEWSDRGGTLTRQITQSKEGVVTVRWEFEFPKGLKAKNMELTLNIPRAALDRLPAAGKGADLVKFGPAAALETLGGRVTLDPNGSTLPWKLQDMREVAWSKQFRLIFSSEYDPEKGLKATAVLSFSVAPAKHPAFQTLTLAPAASRPFMDKQGEGWTGQGSGNDLRSLKPGLLVLSGIPFEITGSAVLLKAGHTPTFPAASGAMAPAAPVACEALYALIATAWGAAFDQGVAGLRVAYADGSVQAVPVRYGRDVNDWWNAKPPTDAKLGWVGANGSSTIGLCLMRVTNLDPAKAIASVELVSSNTEATPILVALTLVKAKGLSGAEAAAVNAAFLRRATQKVDTASWFECPLQWRGGILPGSALDFSALNDKPAGKLGFLRRVGPRFEFEKAPGKGVRFWGINYALHGPYPDKDLAAGIAAGAAAQGVNLVRLHLYAAGDRLVASNGQLNPDLLDRMEFLIAELEKNGIYIFMDLNDGMPYEALAGIASTKNDSLKVASLFNADLRRGTKRLATDLFTHVNPYTGKSLARDPAVAMFEIVNECSMFFDWGSLEKNVPEPYRGELRKLWGDWLAAHGHAARGLPEHFKVDAVARTFAEELQTRYLQEMAAHLKSLGVRAPIGGDNITFALGELRATAAAKLDFLGEHSYYDHPGVGSRPMTYADNRALVQPVFHLPMLGELAKGSVKGWPLVAGEWNFCFPNDYRCEGIPYAAAYAAYQDWDGMVFYCATGSFDGGRWARFTNAPGILIHSQQTDPATWGLAQVGAALFRRGDLAVAKRDLELVLPDSAIDENLPTAKKLPFLPALGRYRLSFSGPSGAANWLGELVKSDLSAEEAYKKVLEKTGDRESGAERVVSDTREIRRYPKPGLLLIDTPKTQSISGRLCDLPLTRDRLSSVSVSSPMTWASVNVVSLDGNPIRASTRLLLVAVGNARNKDSRVDADAGLIHQMGSGPVIAEPVLANLTLAAPAEAQVWALHPLTGARMARVAATRVDEGLRIALDGSAKSIYFEVATR